MKLKAWVIENMKKKYKKDMEKLFLDQFTTMLQKLKVEKEEYGRFIEYDYYLILKPINHCNIFIKNFFKSLQDLLINHRSKKSVKI